MLHIPSTRTAEVSAPRGPARLPELRAEVERARPDLPEGSAEFRAAVLLLLVCDGGFNVDRLAARTRFPREFVARCLRRLTDNGLWADGALWLAWREEGARSQAFWWDVDVALGRRLRRTTEDGTPEWAPLDGWVKEFEYSGRAAPTQPVFNEYRYIAPHDPEPVAPSEADEEEGAPEGASEPGPAPLPPGSPRREILQLPVSVDWLGQRERDRPRVEPTSSRGALLVDAWSATEWLG